jgi:predicted O-linked N-acetylglucosamine transferase (SPINDLY family)
VKLRDLFRPRLGPGTVEVQIEHVLRQAETLLAEGRLAEASSAYQSVLDIDAENWASRSALAAIALQTGNLDEAIQRFSELIARRPDFAEAHYKRGNAFNRMGGWPAALADYDQAVTLDPDYAIAFCNRGTVLERLGRWQQALESYDKALSLNPRDSFAHYNRAGVLKELNRPDEAVESYDQAIALNSDYAEAYVNRGHLLHKLSRLEDASASYGKAMELRPVPIGAERGDQTQRLSPEQKYVLGLRRYTRMQLCDWRDIDADIARIAAGLGAHLPVCLPFPALALFDSPPLHRAAAESWIREESPPADALGAIPARPRSSKIRIGYFSADFRSHPVAFLAAGLFERHDRSRFEVTAFAFGPESKDEMRTRLTKAFHRFVDVRHHTDVEVAALARDMGIDIAVDMNGITENARSGIFALRAAPIQVNYLGYPGTMGAEYMDYLIADGNVIPRTHQGHYGEKIIYLPDCFLPFDSSYAIADKTWTRRELGLPSERFVFCCFNNAFKITPAIFDSWMRILSRAEESVLWLAPTNSTAAANLRKEAVRRGVAPERLIFAARLPSLPEHLARLRAADLFLDTFPYNAHASALDALWAGLPVLTREGQGFASRVAASALRTINLRHLITDSLSAYEATATALAGDPVRLSQMRETLAHNRASTALFDTVRYCRNLEAAYEQIYERRHAGGVPEHVNEDLAACSPSS